MDGLMFTTMASAGAAVPQAASIPSIVRETSPVHDASGKASPPSTPNLGHEVAALSDKLIKAINHQTALEEGLEETKHELTMSKSRIRQLEGIAREHADMMAKGLLVEKKEVEMETRQLMNKLLEESHQRGKAEKEKKNIEQDLENLTSSLFEEANKMVVAARKEREAVIRRNDQLEQQLQDTELLLLTHQEQLAELKMSLQQMSSEREDMDSLSAPSTPILNNSASKESLNRIFEALHLANGMEGSDEIKPANPTSFSHLLQPVLRSDISSYHDFVNVARIPKLYATTTAPSNNNNRQPSGSVSSFTSPFNILGTSTPKHQRSPSSSSATFGQTLSKSLSSIQNSTNTSPSQTLPPAPALKDTAFFKRALVEDIEPTLRLDSAPGLSWVSRRTVLSSIIEGSLVIEAMPPTSRLPMFNCTLCDESRNDTEHIRTHRFRTSETSHAQRYPLCPYCTARLRSVCDFLAFLRTIKDGHWRCDTEEDEKAAWEESVKLREHMFWCRVGGGVVPAPSFTTALKEDLARSIGNSPRSSTDGTDTTANSSNTRATTVTSGSTHVYTKPQESKLVIEQKPESGNAEHSPITMEFENHDSRPESRKNSIKTQPSLDFAGVYPTSAGPPVGLRTSAGPPAGLRTSAGPPATMPTKAGPPALPPRSPTTNVSQEPSLSSTHRKEPPTPLNMEHAVPSEEEEDTLDSISMASKRTRDSHLPSPPESPAVDRREPQVEEVPMDMPGGFS